MQRLLRHRDPRQLTLEFWFGVWLLSGGLGPVTYTANELWTGGVGGSGVLTPILATGDPYAAADEFVGSGWTLVFATPEGSGDPLACVELHGGQVMLGVDSEEFLAVEARGHRGAGVQFYLEVPADVIDAVHAAHREPGPIEQRAWGTRSFVATLAGYNFMIATAQD